MGVRRARRPSLRLIDCTKLRRPANGELVDVVRGMLANAISGEMTGMVGIVSYADGRVTRYTTGEFGSGTEVDANRVMAEAMRLSVSLAMWAEEDEAG